VPDRTTASRSLERAAAVEPRVVQRDDSDYPLQLRDLPHPPACLWTVGRLELAAGRPIVAIVGTRNSTPYGERVTRELARALARAGACIVSGMARGIDATAHRAALDEGGDTIAVLGTGIDVPYPVGHRVLHRTIGERGLLVAEFPPGTRAFRGCFPRRNRIIAALASVTIVVEAPRGSGALNTAEQVLELGRTLGVVPGPVDAPQSEGSNRLFREAGHPILEPADALSLVGLTSASRVDRAFSDPDMVAVWDVLGRGAVDCDALCALSRLPAQRCLAAVTELELAGAVECSLTGVIRRR
jgi:DNA processing protein